jgi:two-component system sensor histidine kinase DctS
VLALLGWATYLTWRQAHGVALAEAAWRGEAAWRRAMEDALTVGLRARDMDGRLLYVNRRMCELTGFSEPELVGRAPPMPYWPPDEIEQVMQRHLRNMAGGAPTAGYESRWLGKDGREIVVMLFEAPLIDPSGRQIGWLGSVVDVTERRRAEELERRRAERAAYQARLMTLGVIAASLAHELNQPLAAITSYGAGVRNALVNVPGIDARVLAALERQGEQAAAAARIVERIRAFLSRRAPQQERCELQAIVGNAALLLRPDLARRGIEFTVELPTEPLAEPLALDADPVLIEQVIVNLVRNAADALDGRPAPRTVSVQAGADAAAVWLEVRDNGAGLGGRAIGELTAPFYSTKDEGMGLGLAICRSIVEAHVGELSAADHPAGGAIFRVRLPRAVEVQPATVADAEAAR